MGRILMAITGDTCGWHDTISGVSSAAVRERYGEARYQEHRNAFHRDGRGLFLIELGKWGLGRKDLVAQPQLFQQGGGGRRGTHGLRHRSFQARGQRGPACADGHPGGTQHLPPPPDRTRSGTRPMELALYRTVPAADDDPCRLSCPENGRGFANTAIYRCQY